MYISHFYLEDFKRELKSRYIQQRPNTNVLNHLSNDQTAKAEIVKYVVEWVKKSDRNALPTHFHVQWAMESIGYAFSLNIDQHSTIKQAIEIYTHWLNYSKLDLRPSVIAEEEGFYQREMISHFSLLFVERGGDSKRHAELCAEVLYAIRELIRTQNLEEITWGHLLKIMLIITNGLLRNKSSMAQDLCPLLLKTLFEIWLRSDTRDEQLWTELHSGFPYWLGHMWLVYQWNTVAFALTERVASIIYGDEHPYLTLKFKAFKQPTEEKDEHLTLPFTTEQTIFFWAKFMNLVLKNMPQRTPADPEVHRKLAKRIAEFTNVFLGINERRNLPRVFQMPNIVKASTPASLSQLTKEFQETHFHYLWGISRLAVPSANALLRIFGRWLFYYARSKDKFIDECRAHAVGALCRIMCRGSGPVSRQYVGLFYKTIFECVSTDKSSTLKAYIAKNSMSLMCSELEGINVLLFEGAITEILSTGLDHSGNNGPKFRTPFYYILSSFVGTVHLYENYKLKKVVSGILLDTLKWETDENNFFRLVWSISVFLSTLHTDSELLTEILRALVERLGYIDCMKDHRIYKSLLKVITTLPFLLNSKVIVDEDLVTEVIRKICSEIKNKLTVKKERLLSSLLYTLLHWLVCFPYAALNTRSTALEVISLAYKIDVIRDIANYTYDFIMNNLGKQLPPLSYTAYDSLYVSTGSFSFHQIKLGGKHFLMGGRFLLSFYDSSQDNPNHEEILLVIRNPMGKYFWKAELVYSKEPQPKDQLQLSMTVHPPKPQPRNSGDSEQKEELDSNLNESEKTLFQELKSTMEAQEKTCNAFKEEVRFEDSHFRVNSQKEFLPKSYRLLLTHLGLFNQENLESFIALEGQELKTKIIELDSISDKECISLPVLYLKTPESKDTEVLASPDYYSRMFQQFLPQLGVLLDNSHINIGIFSQVASYIRSFSSVLYTSHYYYELVSLFPGLIPGESTLQDLLKEREIVVLWNERANDPHSKKFPSLLEHPVLAKKVCILLTPLQKDLVKVNIWPRPKRQDSATEVIDSGPLMNDMLVPLYLLGSLLVRSVVNLNDNLKGRISGRNRRLNIFRSLEEMGRKAEATKNGKLSAILSHAFKTN